jgi:hypothetical protein
MSISKSVVMESSCMHRGHGSEPSDSLNEG